MSSVDGRKLADLLGLFVHDLRNPGATIGANLTYVREVYGQGKSEDVDEALADVGVALDDLLRGLDHLAWIGRWLGGVAASGVVDGDVAATLRQLRSPDAELSLEVDVPPDSLPARGGATPLREALGIVLANALQHARRGTVRLAARREGDAVVVEVTDRGRAVGPDLREVAFGLEGQQQIKGRVDGRYSRAAGLLALRALADAMGAVLEADGTDGSAVFRLRLAPVGPG